MTIDDIDLVEINEAFAAQVIPSYRDLAIDIDKLNVNGGAIAVGHPFGMTGARITSTLLNSLQFHDKTFGLETMCVGGGQGMAMIVERLRVNRPHGRSGQTGAGWKWPEARMPESYGRGLSGGVLVVQSRQQESVGPGGARDTEPLPGDA